MSDAPVAPVWLDGWRLSLGTLTALPVTPPSRVDRPSAAVAMAIAPLAALPLGVLAGAVAWLGSWLGLPGAVVGVLVVAALALANRGMHLDGLADTADGLAAPKDADGRLAIMRTGDVGPVGAAALVLVLGVQVTALSIVLSVPGGWLAAGLVVCASRAALAVVCVRGVPAARGSGLGAAVAGTVPRVVAVVVWVAVGAALAVAHTLGPAAEEARFSSRVVPAALSYFEDSTWQMVLDRIGFDWVSGLVSAAVGVVVVALLVRRAVRAVGGVTGDVCGAAVELCLATLLVALLV